MKMRMFSSNTQYFNNNGNNNGNNNDNNNGIVNFNFKNNNTRSCSRLIFQGNTSCSSCNNKKNK